MARYFCALVVIGFALGGGGSGAAPNARAVPFIKATSRVTPAANAATRVTATIMGTVYSGWDVAGSFGLGKDVSLAGVPYTLVYTMDDTKGSPAYGTFPSCQNGRANLGLSSPVTQAVLTINGRSYTFGNSALTSVKSWVEVGNATSPKTWLLFGFVPSRASYLIADEHVNGEIELNSLNLCRSWSSAFTYTLQPSDLYTTGFGAVAELAKTNALTPSVDFNFDLGVQSVKVSGPVVPCVTSTPKPKVTDLTAMSRNNTLSAIDRRGTIAYVVGTRSTNVQPRIAPMAPIACVYECTAIVTYIAEDGAVITVEINVLVSDVEALALKESGVRTLNDLYLYYSYLLSQNKWVAAITEAGWAAAELPGTAPVVWAEDRAEAWAWAAGKTTEVSAALLELIDDSLTEAKDDPGGYCQIPPAK